jgi:Fic family protein
MSAVRRFKPYPAYKDSGVEWLAEIPAHWAVKRLKTLASVQLSNVDKKSVEGEEPVKLCNYTDVYYNERITSHLEFMTATASREQARRFSLRAGDVLITKDSESWTDIAVPALVAEDLRDVLCGYHLAHVRPGRGCVGAFLCRAFSAIGPRNQFHVAANGITRFGLGGDAIRTGMLAMPPEPEQRAIAAFLDRETVPEADPDDVRELLNYRRAFEFVSTYLGEGGPITEGLVREIHRRLVEGVRGGAAAPGEYRRVQNYVVNSATGAVVYTPPPAHDVPILMREMVSWLNDPGDAHPVLASGVGQFQLVHIHPFLDGNGRTSRLLSTLCLYRAGYDFKRLFAVSEYYDRDRPAFYRAIQSVRERGMDLTGWLEYFTEGLATQLDEVKARGERAIRAEVLARKHGLSDRQAVALGRVLEAGRLTIQEFEALCPDANRRTLQRDLKVLVAKGLLVERGSGPTDPTRHYRLAEAIRARLKEL